MKKCFKECFKEEICRAYMVLGETAEMQNDMDIEQWYKNKLISDIERQSLKKYNRSLMRHIEKKGKWWRK